MNAPSNNEIGYQKLPRIFLINVMLPGVISLAWFVLLLLSLTGTDHFVSFTPIAFGSVAHRAAGFLPPFWSLAGSVAVTFYSRRMNGDRSRRWLVTGTISTVVSALVLYVAFIAARIKFGF